MFKIAICDDDPNIRKKYISYIDNISIKYDISTEVKYETGNPYEFLEYIAENDVDIIFLDINLKSSITGIELAKKIREINKPIYIIFITGHIEYILLSFKVTTFDYLVKPVSQDKLEECLLRLYNYANVDSLNYLKIKSGTSIHIVKKSNIIYIEKSNAKVYIYTDSEVIETYSSLESLQNSLPSYFMRCHKSYIINSKKISKFDSSKNEIYLENNIKCDIGRKYKKEMWEAMKND